jgi:TATA-box binding protein (TBP) (component of TFIID and TFIIIB)
MSQLIQFFRRKKPPSQDNTTVWVKVTNVVATTALHGPIDLNAVVEAYPFAEYRPEQFPGVVLRLHKPKAVILLFHTGKLVCTGAASTEQAQKAITWSINCKPTRLLINMMYPLQFKMWSPPAVLAAKWI